jgi:hypothetical protein
MRPITKDDLQVGKECPLRDGHGLGSALKNADGTLLIGSSICVHHLDNQPQMLEQVVVGHHIVLVDMRL